MRKFGRLLLSSIFALSFVGSAPVMTVASPKPERVYYEIFVRSFQDSDGDGIGDLRGVTSRLDYLKSLGIGGIWLTPIFKSPSYHGYDTTDYRSLQPAFGTLADFDALIAAAHARDIRVVLDFAINHTSSRHPWFSTRHDWYVWRDQNPGWPGPQHWFERGQEFYYAYFGVQMPDLNLQNRDVVREIQDSASYWLARGVDGFRLDAARYYIEGPQGEPDTTATHTLIRELAASFKNEHPEMTLIGEVWSGLDTIAPYISSGSELDLAFDFPFSGGLLSSLNTSSAQGLSSVIRQSAQIARLAPFLTNHDMNRIASQLSKHKDPVSVVPLLKLAAAALFSQPGTPFIYYGEEIGMSNGHTGTRGDLDKRTPMQWERGGHHGFTPASSTPWTPFASEDPAVTVQDQLSRPGSLLETYRALIALRLAHPALHTDGAIQALTDPGAQIVAYLRSEAGKHDGERILVVLNFGARATDPLTLDVSGDSPEIIWGEGSVKRRAHTKLEISGLAPQSAVWIRL